MRTLIGCACLFAAAAGCDVGSEEDQPATYLAAIEQLAPPDVVRSTIERAGGDFNQLWPHLGIIRFTATPAQKATLVERPYFLAIERVRQGPPALYERARPSPRQALGAQVTPWGIARVGGAAPPTGATLWVLDSGVDLEHPDLRIDAEQSRDIVAELGGDTEPDLVHGTAVAGVATALDNDRDVVGVAPGARVVSVRVLDRSGYGRRDVIIAGLDYAVSRADPGDVFNLSSAAEGNSEVLETAIARVADRGIRVVLAAGNWGQDAAKFTPAGVDHPGVYTVSAMNEDDCLADFSNYGAVVDVAAPGTDILTLRVGGGTIVFEGTSFAAPHVAGLLLAGRLKSAGTLCGAPDDERVPIAHN